MADDSGLNLPGPGAMKEHWKALEIKQKYCLEFLEEVNGYQYISSTGNITTLRKPGALKLLKALNLAAECEISVTDISPEIATKAGGTQYYHA